MTEALRRVRGSILLLALVFVVMLGLLAASVVQTATLQLRMAGNAQLREEAGHLAGAIVAELSSYSENFLLDTEVGHTNCRADDADTACDSRTLRPSVSALAADGYDLNYRVTRVPPLRREGYPLSGVQGTTPVSMAVFEVEVEVDGRHRRRGNAHVVQGVALQIPESPGSVVDSVYRVYWREPGPDPL